MVVFFQSLFLFLGMPPFCLFYHFVPSIKLESCPPSYRLPNEPHFFFFFLLFLSYIFYYTFRHTISIPCNLKNIELSCTVPFFQAHSTFSSSANLVFQLHFNYHVVSFLTPFLHTPFQQCSPPTRFPSWLIRILPPSVAHRGFTVMDLEEIHNTYQG